MPSQLAHDAVGLVLDYTGKTVEYCKSKPGLLNTIISRVEGPVAKTLESRAAKTVLKVGDQVLTTVDGTIDKAIGSTYYKSGEAYVKSTYSNKIVPATNTVTTTVATTTSRVTTPVVNVYTGVLAFADKQVRIPSHPFSGPDAKCEVAAESSVRFGGKHLDHHSAPCPSPARSSHGLDAQPRPSPRCPARYWRLAFPLRLMSCAIAVWKRPRQGRWWDGSDKAIHSCLELAWNSPVGELE